MKKNKIFNIIFLLMIILGISTLSGVAIARMSMLANTKEASSYQHILCKGEKDPAKYKYELFEGQSVVISNRNVANSKELGKSDFDEYCNKFPYERLNIPLFGKYSKIYCIEPGHANALKYIRDGKTLILPPAVAYIISEQPRGEWTREKQLSIWRLRLDTYKNENGEEVRYDEQLIGDGTSVYDDGESSPHLGDTVYTVNWKEVDRLLDEAKKYADHDKKVRNNGVKRENKTNLTDVKVDKKGSEYIIGPLSVDYTDCYDGGIAFGGISDIEVLGYGITEKKEINISKIQLCENVTGDYKEYTLNDNSSSKTFSYFVPDEVEKTYKYDKDKEVYLQPKQKFKIVINDPNENNNADKILRVSVKVKFQYMLANGKYNKYKGDNQKEEGQKLMAADAIRSLYEQEITIPDITIFNTIELGGYVWEDEFAGKENNANGLRGDIGDRDLKNIKVSLYEKGTDKLAKLLIDPYEANISNEEIYSRINPTLTNENGKYLFKGIDPSKEYYVEFEYSGQEYIPTHYLMGEYNNVNELKNAEGQDSERWKNSSKALEVTRDRELYNGQFAEIKSYPDNYFSKNLNANNIAFSRNDLIGKGKEGTKQLIDTFVKIDEDGIVDDSNNFIEGEISKKIRTYIETNKAYPNNIKDEIYLKMAPKDSMEYKMLMFIEDTKIKAYSMNFQEKEFYPINKEKNEQYINLGLWRRQKTNLSLQKDIAFAATTINDKMEVYEYNKRKSQEYTKEEQDEINIINEKIRKGTWTKDDLARLQEIDKLHNWQIEVRLKEINGDYYYSKNYARELYDADYKFIGEKSNRVNNSKNLELYITYKIAVHNSSQGIANSVMEVVDYYDKDYTYINDLSWIMYDDVSFSSEEYQKFIQNGTINDRNGKYKEIGLDVGASGNNTLYIKGLKDKKLKSGENAYIYLTFRVNKSNGTDNQGIITERVKNNIVEINGYKTYYEAGTILPNKETISDDNTIAGLIDYNSKPGNININDVIDNEGNLKQNCETSFEDDTDRAKGIEIKVLTEYSRKLSGYVWEDSRTKKAGETWIGDGIRDEKEIGINGVEVQLVEKLKDGSEYLWATATSGSPNKANKNDIILITEKKGEQIGNPNSIDGYYRFSNLIPGEYVVRFIYGNKEECVRVQGDGVGQNATSYNGQDYKSTVIVSADGKNVSDAKDDYGRRQKVINYSNNNVTNSKAEILAAPYGDKDSNKVDALKANTHMTAQTMHSIVFECENSENHISDSEDSENGKYSIENIDLGLVERPKAQLELNKKVNNVKITLMNGTVLFDAKDKVDNLLWVKRSPYELDTKKTDGKYDDYYTKNHRYAYRAKVDEIVESTYKKGLIQATMDDEQMHGATIQITYDFYVKNVGEVDYNNQDFYYNGTNYSNKVTTTVNTVIDYIANNLKFKPEDNEGWTIRKIDDIKGNYVKSDLHGQIEKYNTILTTEFNKKTLLPGETTETKQLTLTQLITPQNKDDELTYKNIAEIVEISNDVGRRMAFSIQGNQDPTATPAEVDSFAAEDVKILPPYGMKYTYYALGIAVATILIAGVVLIKKKVLK